VALAAGALACLWPGAGGRSAALRRALAVVALGGAAGAAWRLAVDAEWDAGRFLVDGALVADHLAGVLDLLVVAATAVALGLAPRGEARPGCEPALLLGAVGAGLLVHAGDLVIVVAGAELTGLAIVLLAAMGPDRRVAARMFSHHALSSVLLVLGVALLHAGVSATDLAGLGSRAAAVFNQWGAVQPYVEPLEAGLELPSGVAAQFRGRVIQGMASAALFVPGMLFLLAGLGARLGLVPLHRVRDPAVAGLPVALAGFVVLVEPLAFAAPLLRVFLANFDTARLVAEPYGWTGPLPFLGFCTLAWAGVSALRERGLVRLVALLSACVMGHVVIGISAAASFYGHRAAVSRGVTPTLEASWAQLAGDGALTGVLLTLGTWVLAGGGLLAAAAAVRRDGAPVRLEAWAGLGRARPGLAWSIAACAASLAAIPPLLGGVAGWLTLRALLEHSALRWLAVPVALAHVLELWVLVRVILVVFARRAPAERPPEVERRPERIAALLAIAGVVGGLAAGAVIDGARLAAAGASMPPESPERAQWVGNERASRDAR
jgi:NADH-quinone oxidoreductase subunit N